MPTGHRDAWRPGSPMRMGSYRGGIGDPRRLGCRRIIATHGTAVAHEDGLLHTHMHRPAQRSWASKLSVRLRWNTFSNPR